MKLSFLITFYLTTAIVLIFSLTYLLFPIFLRVKRKKISTLNSKFTLYFILIALTPSIFLGVIGLVLINFGINDWFNSKINNVIKRWLATTNHGLPLLVVEQVFEKYVGGCVEGQG